MQIPHASVLRFQNYCYDLKKIKYSEKNSSKDNPCCLQFAKNKNFSNLSYIKYIKAVIKYKKISLVIVKSELEFCEYTSLVIL